MKIRRITIIFMVAMLMAVATGLVNNRLTAHHRNMNELVARALSRDAGIDYVAQVVTTAQYNGKIIRTHATVYHQGTAEKVEYSGKPGQRVWSISRDGSSYTYLPGENKILVSETSRTLSNAQRNKLLLDNYNMVSNGNEKIAGRDAYVVVISPRRNGRPSKKLWIDKQHMTVLKSIDYSASGNERGSMEIERIKYNAKIDRKVFDIPGIGSTNMVIMCKSAKSADLFKMLKLPVRAPRYIPAGYKVEGYHLFNCQCNCNHRSAQITYTDGLNIISVFQTPNMTSCKDSGCSMAESGSDNSCSIMNCDVAKTGHMSHGDRTVVVVGDLMPAEVQKITESVR